jgi:hypothetical protein
MDTGYFRNCLQVRGLDSIDSGWGPVSGSCEHCNEPSGSKNGRHFFIGWAAIRFLEESLLHVVSDCDYLSCSSCHSYM